MVGRRRSDLTLWLLPCLQRAGRRPGEDQAQVPGQAEASGGADAADCGAPLEPGQPAHTVAECQFSTNLIITFDRDKIQSSNWHQFVSLAKAIRMTYNKASTDQVMTLIRGRGERGQK